MRGMVLAVVAMLIGLAHPAVADDPPASGRSIRDALPLFGKNHCELLRDLAEQFFCGDGELNAISVKLNAAIQDRLSRLANRRLAIGPPSWSASRKPGNASARDAPMPATGSVF